MTFLYNSRLFSFSKFARHFSEKQAGEESVRKIPRKDLLWYNFASRLNVHLYKDFDENSAEVINI